MRGLVVRLKTLIRSERGNVAITAAILFPVLMTVAAFAVDEAALHYQKRQLQAATDMAAIHAAADPANALARAHAVLLDYRAIDPAIPLGELADPVSGALRVQTGRYTADTALSVDARFVPGAMPPNAVEVRLERPGTLHFARSFMARPPVIGVGALASATPRAAFSVGSRLASLNGGLINALLGQLLGTNLSLSLLDYQAIAGLDIAMVGFLDALAGQIGMTAGTYGQVLGANVALSDIALALVAAAGGQDPAAIALLAGLAGAIDDGIVVEMTRLIAADGLADLALGAPNAGAQLGINAFELLTVAALLADGDRQIALALGSGLPGIAGVSAHLLVGEPPQAAWYGFGPAGSFVRTAQLRLRLDISVLGNGGPGIGLLDIGLPVYAELAFAEAQLASLDCPAGRPDLGMARLAVRPGVLRLAVGNMAPGSFTDTAMPLSVSRASIVNVASIARVTARAQVESAQTDPHILHIGQPELSSGTLRTVSTTTPLSSLTTSLVGNLDLRLETLGVNLLGGLLNGVTATVQTLLDPVGPALDMILLNLFGAVGIAVGQADVRMHGLDCRAATLVQ